MSKKTYIGFIVVIVALVGVYLCLGRFSGVATDDSANPGQSSSSPLPPPPTMDTNKFNTDWQQLIALANGPAAGNPGAAYTMIEIGDFQCPQCGKSRPYVEELINHSAGRAKLYFVNFPLHMHPHAQYAAQASLAASRQGQFWKMYDLLYSHQDELIPSEIQYYTEQEIPSINITKFEQDLSSPSVVSEVGRQVDYVQSLGVYATPTFLIRKSAGGSVGVWIGMKDDNGALGLSHVLKNPPWSGKP